MVKVLAACRAVVQHVAMLIANPVVRLGATAAERRCATHAHTVRSSDASLHRVLTLAT
jgi:hypothetical protein